MTDSRASSAFITPSGDTPARPSVTVVIPCFNYGRFVEEAARSALAQQGADVRVVIVDDGSTDGESPAACDACLSLSPSVAVLHQANAGAPAARNAGAGVAAESGWGEYLVFLDADDWIEPTFVAELHAAILGANDPDVSHAYCQERLVERGQGVWRVPDWDPVLLLVTNLHPITALIRREAFERVGGFDQEMTVGYEDWDLWVRLASLGYRGVRVREPLFVWRRHSDRTLVMQHVQRHDELYARLVSRNRAMFQRHAEEVIRCANALLRRSDANWLDETGEAIVIRDNKRWIEDLIRERDQARAELGEALERAQAGQRRFEDALAQAARAPELIAAARQEAAEAVRREYEAKPSVRISRAAFKLLDRMPRQISAPLRALARAARGSSRPISPASGADRGG